MSAAEAVLLVVIVLLGAVALMAGVDTPPRGVPGVADPQRGVAGTCVPLRSAFSLSVEHDFFSSAYNLSRDS